MNNQQLIKKDINVEGGYRNIFPYTNTECVKDKQTSEPLDSMLTKSNFYYLAFAKDNETTRIQLNPRYRKLGCILSFLDYDNFLHTEFYNNNNIEDEEFAKDENWIPLLSYYNGTFIVPYQTDFSSTVLQINNRYRHTGTMVNFDSPEGVQSWVYQGKVTRDDQWSLQGNWKDTFEAEKDIIDDIIDTKLAGVLDGIKFEDNVLYVSVLNDNEFTVVADFRELFDTVASLKQVVDKLDSVIRTDGNGAKYLTDAGTYKPFPTKVSQFQNDAQYQTKAQVDKAIADLVDSAPETLDTLNELAAALGDDPNFATTVTKEIAKKADKTYVDSEIASINQDIENINSDINNVNSDIQAINQNIDTIEGNIQSINTELDTKEDKANIGNVSSLTTTAKTVVPAINELKSNIDSLNTSTNADLEEIRQDITSIEQNVDTVENNISSIESNIDAIEGSISTINNNISSINAKNTEQDSAINGIEQTIEDLQGNNIDDILDVLNGGTNGQVLKKSNNTLAWGTDNDTKYNNATTSVAGLMSATDKAKLDGIANNANNYSLPLAANGTRGGIQIGYSQTENNRAVQLSSEKAYVNIPNASTSAAGLMTEAQVTKLNGIADNANNYVHPTTAGNKHIPAGGSSGQILRWSAAGTAVWGSIPNIDIIINNGNYVSNITASGHTLNVTRGTLPTSLKNPYALTIQRNGSSVGTYDGSEAKTINITDNNTTYTAGTGLSLSGTTFSLDQATSSERGGIRIGFPESGKNYPVELNSSGQAYVNVPWTDTNTTYGLATTSANGLLRQLNGSTSSFMRGDGTWATPPDTNTTYTAGTGLTLSGTAFSLKAGTSSTIGGFKVYRQQTATASAAAMNNTSGKIYGVQSDNSNRLWVCVPWTDTTYNVATQSAKGLMSAADKTKLDNLGTAKAPVVVDCNITPGTSTDYGQPWTATTANYAVSELQSTTKIVIDIIYTNINPKEQVGSVSIVTSYQLLNSAGSSGMSYCVWSTKTMTNASLFRSSILIALQGTTTSQNIYINGGDILTSSSPDIDKYSRILGIKVTFYY